MGEKQGSEWSEVDVHPYSVFLSRFGGDIGYEG